MSVRTSANTNTNPNASFRIRDEVCRRSGAFGAEEKYVQGVGRRS